jgi:para-nitrobenzyl esterase
MKRGAMRLALALLWPAAVAAAPSAPSVTIDSGEVVGVQAGPAVVFRAIPYAAAPVGPLRWKPPQPPAHWAGPRAADRTGPACPQIVTPGVPNEGGYAGPISEDCLSLDVTAPPGASKAPVMVWIFGGGNISGATDLPSYDSANFARDGVIVVAMNYRLGPLGFFAHPALTAEAPPGAPLANYGLMDQVAALRWVRRNIAAFGGDPDNVTLFGESAGGEDVLALMTIPTARGLFQKAIVQSGAAVSTTPLAKAEAQGIEIVRRSGSTAPAPTADDLRALPVDALLHAGGQAAIAVDGGLVEEDVRTAFRRGDQARTPLILGWNSNEASLMRAFGITPAQWVARTPASVKAAYGAGGAGGDADLARNLFNDEVMGAPSRWFAKEQTHWRAPAWLYYFSYLPERYRPARPGVNHASEIPYVFDSIDAIPGRAALAGPKEHAEAALAHACWVAFARLGRLDCAGDAWKPYEPQGYVVFEFGDEPGPRVDFRKAQLDAQAAADPALAADPSAP